MHDDDPVVGERCVLGQESETLGFELVVARNPDGLIVCVEVRHHDVLAVTCGVADQPLLQ